MKPVHVVTGANSGIGLAMARALSAGGAHVAMVCRNREKGEAARASVQDAELFIADLSLMSDVRRVATELGERYPRIDVLVNNAGTYLHANHVTSEGFESVLAVNHLAPFLLTHLLQERIEAAAPARVVTTSSSAHRGARIDFDDLGCQGHFEAWRQYCNTKLMNILFTKELARRVESRGITANCFHPGAVGTGFAQDDAGVFGVLVRMGRPFLKSPERAAKTGVLLATSPEVAKVSGEYFVGRKPHATSRMAQDPDLATRLWAATEKLLGLA